MQTLTGREIKVLRSFMETAEWNSIKIKLLLDCPNSVGTSDTELIRNAVGFQYWHKAVAQLEAYAGGATPRRAKADPEELEYENEMARPPA